MGLSPFNRGNHRNGKYQGLKRQGQGGQWGWITVSEGGNNLPGYFAPHVVQAKKEGGRGGPPASEGAIFSHIAPEEEVARRQIPLDGGVDSSP